MKTRRLVISLALICLIALCAPLAAQEEFASGLGAFNATLSGATPTIKYNPLQVATLRWYEGTNNGPDIEMPIANSFPLGLAFDGIYMYITCPGAAVNRVYRSVASGASMMAFGAVWAAGEAPWGVAYDGRNIWVTSFSAAGFVRKMDIANGATITTVPTLGTAATGIAFDGTNIWVANFGSANISKINAKSPGLPATYGVGTNPQGVAFDGTNIWVANQGSNNVMKINAATGAIMKTINVGIHPVGLAFDGSSMWVACQGDGSPANPGKVYKLTVSSGAKSKTISFANPAQPTNLAFDGNNMWVTMRGSNQVAKIAVSNGKILGTFNVGALPWGIAFDGHNMWVANSSDNSLSIR
jgi:YVTN family beta-propeller protein